MYRPVPSQESQEASTGAWWLTVAPSVLLANALTVALTAVGGDLLSQSLEASGYSLARTVRFTLFRICFQMPIYAAWIGFLERFNHRIPPNAVPAAKTAIECVTYTPLYQMFFFTVMALSEGLALSEAFGRAVQTLPVSLPASFKFWIPVQLFTYGSCPVQWRVSFVNVVSLVWNAIMSSFNAGAL